MVLKTKVKGLLKKRNPHTLPSEENKRSDRTASPAGVSRDRLKDAVTTVTTQKEEGVIQCDSGLYKVRVGFMQRLKD